MPTFLTTSKMSPALAARIEASVTGRKLQPADAHRAPRTSSVRMRRFVSIARLVLVLTVAFAIYNFIVFRRESQRALVQARASLLESVRVQRESISAEDTQAVPRIETWLTQLSGPYEGDLVDAELRGPGKLAETLARPMVYVRGAVDALVSPQAVAAAARASTKDAVVVCLVDPPATRTEPALLDKVRIAYAGGRNVESRTTNVRPLNDAIMGLPFLQPEWAERVQASEDARELARLRADFERAPIEHAKQAARSTLLLAVIDEPGDGAGPTELDGERPHAVRVALVDLPSAKVLLRARHVVDPGWITPARKATYAVGLDSCALALDVREDVRRASGAP